MWLVNRKFQLLSILNPSNFTVPFGKKVTKMLRNASIVNPMAAIHSHVKRRLLQRCSR